MSGDDRCDIEWRRAFAQAVTAGERAYILNADNQSRHGFIADAVDADMAFAVIPRRSLIAVDCDTPGASSDASLAELATAAEAADVPTVRCASSPGGRSHLFLVVGAAHCVDRARLVSWARSRGLDVRDRGIRPPLAAHRRGGRSELLEPSGRADALAALTAPGGAARTAALCDKLRIPNLSRRMRDLAAEGTARTAYASPSEGRLAITLAATAAGLPTTFAGVLLRDPFSALGQTFRARPTPWQQQELMRLAAKAQARIGTSAEADGISAWERALQAHSWAGTSSATQLAILEGIARMARRANTLTPQVPLGRCAIEAGVRPETVRRTLPKLMAGGWLAEVGAPTPTSSRRVQLCLPPTADTSVAKVDIARPVFGDLGADLARWRGLGKQAARVLRELRDDPQSTAAIAARLGTTVRSVQTHCNRLAKHGLARRDSIGWILGSASVADVEQSLKVAGSRLRDEEAYLLRQQERRESARRAEGRRRPLPGGGS